MKLNRSRLWQCFLGVGIAMVLSALGPNPNYDWVTFNKKLFIVFGLVIFVTVEDKSKTELNSVAGTDQDFKDQR